MSMKLIHAFCFCLVGCGMLIAQPLVRNVEADNRQAKEFWYLLTESSQPGMFQVDLLSVRQPGSEPDDDFWHIQVLTPDDRIVRLSFDCQTGHYFPDGDVPSKPVPREGILRSAYAIACAPPSQIRRMMAGQK